MAWRRCSFGKEFKRIGNYWSGGGVHWLCLIWTIGKEVLPSVKINIIYFLERTNIQACSFLRIVFLAYWLLLTLTHFHQWNPSRAKLKWSLGRVHTELSQLHLISRLRDDFFSKTEKKIQHLKFRINKFTHAHIHLKCSDVRERHFEACKKITYCLLTNYQVSFIKSSSG